jgi:ABC-type Mn2+/Zn2+ transport system permease subunit
MARSLGALVVVGCVVAIVGGAGGLYTSYRFNLPTGAAIVCTFGALLLVIAIVTKIRNLRAQPVKATQGA